MAVVRGGLRFTGRTVAGPVSGSGGCANFIGQVAAEISKLLCVLAYMQKKYENIISFTLFCALNKKNFYFVCRCQENHYL